MSKGEGGESREVRQFTEEEHDALNSALEKIVFTEKHASKLDVSDTLYNFVTGVDPDVSIYVVDDDELKQELEGAGYGYIAEGLLTHAGTYRNKQTGEIRAHNLFIPKSIYGVLTHMLKTEDAAPR